MRQFATLCFFLAALATLRAQDQEAKLVDRLLRPNTELKNSAQNKKFIADRRSINKQATVGTFYLQKKSYAKQFGGSRDFSSWEFNARSFRGSKGQANTTSRSQILNSERKYSTRMTNDLRVARDVRKTTSGGKFAAQRPFLGKGKSQKALSQHDTPLTIDQVRELLNKNK